MKPYVSIHVANDCRLGYLGRHVAEILKKKKMLQTLLGSSLPVGAHSSWWWGGKTVIGATSADYKLDGCDLDLGFRPLLRSPHGGLVQRIAIGVVI